MTDDLPEQVVKRRKGTPPAAANTGTSWLRFGNGLIVNPGVCPEGRHNFGHWELIEGEHQPDKPNARCKCPAPAEAPK